jgi:succinate dehydrogenase hydrophobic anchor subunit
LLNETAEELTGGREHVWDANQIGVFRDFYFFPTERARPTKIHYPTADINNWFTLIAYRYTEGTREQTEEAVRQWVRENVESAKNWPNLPIVFTYMEDAFNESLRSERALLRLLSLMTLVGVLIAIFGVYSLASLTCQQRRKEIAIRKVSGAEVFDIMNIFFKEYLILLAISAAVAFPTGFIIMRRWLEDYVRQTSMDAWIFVLIFLVMFAVIVLSILSTVWRAANQNPAEVVKSE